MNHLRYLGVAAIVWAVSTSSGVASDEWLGFRGDGRSVAETADLPTDWSVESGQNVAWQVDLPGRGVSSPIVVGGKVIVTCSSGPREDRLHVLAFDELSGKLAWQRNFWATGRTVFNETSAVAANTPVSDGQRIFAFFSSNDLIALDLDGNVLWIRGLQLTHPAAGNDFGMASSPATTAGAVLVQSESNAASFVEAFDVRSGASLWQREMPRKPTWCSPVAMAMPSEDGKVAAFAVQSIEQVEVFEATSGELLWHEAMSCESIPSLVFAGEHLYVPSEGLKSFSFASEDQAEAELPVWESSRLKSSSPSPVIYRDQAFVMNRSGVLMSQALPTAEAKEGKRWQLRLGGSYWATPVAAGNRLYCINSDGKASVVELAEIGEKGELVAESEFGEAIFGTPAVAGDAMFVRSHKHLWKIAGPNASARPRAATKKEEL